MIHVKKMKKKILAADEKVKRNGMEKNLRSEL